MLTALQHRVLGAKWELKLVGWYHRTFTGWSIHGSKLSVWFSFQYNPVYALCGWSMTQTKASCMVMIRSALRMYFMVLIKMLMYMHPKAPHYHFLNYIISNQYDHLLTAFFICGLLQMEFWFNYKGRLKKKFKQRIIISCVPSGYKELCGSLKPGFS